MRTNGRSHDLVHMSHDGELQDTFIGSGKGATKSSSFTSSSPRVQELTKEKKDRQGMSGWLKYNFTGTLVVVNIISVIGIAV